MLIWNSEGVFTPAPLCMRSSKGEVTLCVHSHMIPLREWERGGGSTRKSVDEEKKQTQNTAVVDPKVTPGLAPITADLLHKIKSQINTS